MTSPSSQRSAGKIGRDVDRLVPCRMASAPWMHDEHAERRHRPGQLGRVAQGRNTST